MANKMMKVLMGAGLMVLGAVGATSMTALAEGGAGGDVLTSQVEDVDRQDCKEGRRGKKGRRGGKERMLMGAINQLDLTDAQQVQIDAIKTEIQAERDEMRAAKAGRERPGGMKAALLSDSLDADSLHTQLDERLSRHNARAHQKLDHTIEILEVLTPEQRQELAEMAEARRGSRHGHR